MTITLLCKKSEEVEVTLEWEKPGRLYARVYRKVGGEWRQTHESYPYWETPDDEVKARKAYKRYVKRYIQEGR